VIDKVPERLDGSEAELLLRLARATLVNIATGGALPKPDPNSLNLKLTEKRACFVTLKNRGELRGCVGSVVASKPLFEGVMDSVRGAASRDSRFRPVTADEMGNIHIEVSVLTEPIPLNYESPEALLGMLQPYQHGVLLRIGAHTATFLPKVWEDIPDKEEFLARLCAKAGFDARAWRSDDAFISVYEAEVIEENSHSSAIPTPNIPNKTVP
jgi:AmmeMemoRadiSam system protein A